MFKVIFGTLLIITSLFDAWKYVWNAKAVKRAGTAKGHSRKFIFAALINDIIKLGYGFVIFDAFIVVSSLFALGTMLYMFYIQYLYYPYKYRNLRNWKRPNIFKYIWNGILPNSQRKKL